MKKLFATEGTSAYPSSQETRISWHEPNAAYCGMLACCLITDSIWDPVLQHRSRTGPCTCHVLPCLTAYHDLAWQLWSSVITAKREDHRSGWKGNQTFLAAGPLLWSFLSPNIRLKTDLHLLKRKVWASTFQSLFLSATYKWFPYPWREKEKRQREKHMCSSSRVKTKDQRILSLPGLLLSFLLATVD